MTMQHLINNINENYRTAESILAQAPPASAGSIRTALESAVKLFWVKRYGEEPSWWKDGRQVFNLMEALKDEKFESCFSKIAISDMHLIRKVCNEVLHPPKDRGQSPFSYAEAEELFGRLTKCIGAIEEALGVQIIQPVAKQSAPAAKPTPAPKPTQSAPAANPTPTPKPTPTQNAPTQGVAVQKTSVSYGTEDELDFRYSPSERPSAQNAPTQGGNNAQSGNGQSGNQGYQAPSGAQGASASAASALPDVKAQAKALLVQFLQKVTAIEQFKNGLSVPELFHGCGFGWGEQENATVSQQQFWLVALLWELATDGLVTTDGVLWRLTAKGNAANLDLSGLYGLSFEKAGAQVCANAKRVALAYMRTRAECTCVGAGLFHTELFRGCGFEWKDCGGEEFVKQQYWMIGLLRALERLGEVRFDGAKKLWRLAR